MIWKVVAAAVLLLVAVALGVLAGVAILLADDARLEKKLGPIPDAEEVNQ